MARRVLFYRVFENLILGDGSVAQLVAQRTWKTQAVKEVRFLCLREMVWINSKLSFNPWVVGSSPTRPTI